MNDIAQPIKFDNRVNVINADGEQINPTFIRRARGLVKAGKAHWVSEKTIQIFNSLAQDGKQTFLEYLGETKAKKAIAENSLVLVEKLTSMFSGNPPSAEMIGEFIKDIEKKGVRGDGVGCGGGALKTAYEFLDIYAEYSGVTSEFSEAYRTHLGHTFEHPVRLAMNCLKKAIVFIPDSTVIDPYFLDGFDNDEFVEAFKSFQHFVYSIYEEIENTSPLEWGWQGAKDIEAYGVHHDRVLGILWSLLDNGEVENDMLIVNKEKFWKCHKDKNRVTPMIEGFTDMGLLIEGFDDKKAKTFNVTCPDTPRLFAFLKVYLKERQRECCKCHMHEVYPCRPNCRQRKVCHQRSILSHRFFETYPPEIHDTDVLILAVTDSAPPELAEILHYLHEEAAKHSFRIEPWTVAHNGAINHMLYTDNWHIPNWLRVGSGTYWGDWFYKMQTGKWEITPFQPSKPLFKKIFKKHPEKAAELLERFPNSFTENGGEYIFNIQNPTLDEVKFVLELYKLEHNIKPL